MKFFSIELCIPKSISTAVLLEIRDTSKDDKHALTENFRIFRLEVWAASGKLVKLAADTRDLDNLFKN